MAYQCCVSQCKNKCLASKAAYNRMEKTAVSFFEFPLSPTRKRDWCEKIGRPFYRPIRSSRICSLHFDEKQFVRTGNGLILNDEAVPLNLNSTENKTPRRLTPSSNLRVENYSLTNITTRRFTRSSSNLLKEITSIGNITTRRFTRSSSNLSKENLTLSNITTHQPVINSKNISKENKSLNNNTHRRLIPPNLQEKTTSFRTSTPFRISSCSSKLSKNTTTGELVTNKESIVVSNITTRQFTRSKSKISKEIQPSRNNTSHQHTNKENISFNSITTRRSARSSSKVSNEINPLKNNSTRQPSNEADIPLRKITDRRFTRSALKLSKEIAPLTNNTTRQLAKNASSLSKENKTVSNITTRRFTNKSSNILKEVTPSNKGNKRVNPDALVPENAIKRRRNSVLIGSNHLQDAAVVPNQNKRERKKAISNNQLSIRNFLTSAIRSPEPKDNTVSSTEDCVFGWTTIGEHHIPYLVRNSEKYCALRMIDAAVLAAYQKKKIPKIDSCGLNIQCYDPTAAQCDLLNEINLKHCDCKFGRSVFTWKDKLVRLSDACKYYIFLEVSQLKGVQASAKELEFGFTFVNDKSYIPYIVRNGKKFIPLTYLHCDGDIFEFLHANAQKLSGSDALFLKFCCKYDGISEMNEWIDVIDLEKIQRLSPPKTTFQDSWPTDQGNYHLRVVQTTKGLRLQYDKRFT